MKTLKHHDKQNFETFISLKKFNNLKIQNKECRNKCYIKYDKHDDDPIKNNNLKTNLKICKKHCSCKKKCKTQLNKKKCMKKCKTIKEQIIVDDNKKKRNELKKNIKDISKKEKKKNKIEILRNEQKTKRKNNNNLPEEKINYFTYLINNYLSEDEKMYILDFNKNINFFFKDLHNIFKY